MDKRSFIFVITLSLTLLAVNTFFHWLNRGEVEKWQEQQKAGLLVEEKQLAAKIAEHTAKPQDLPLVDLFADNAAQKFIGRGVKAGDTVLTLSWAPELPKTLYSRPANTEKQAEKIDLAYAPENPKELAVYRAKPEAKIPLISLPPEAELQLIELPQGGIVLGDYADGELTIPAEQLQKIRIRLGEAKDLSKVGNALALYQSKPVAVYASDTKSLVMIEHLFNLGSLISAPEVKKTAKKAGSEKFYVLENEYQQLVFSNYGAALSEINLPFKNESNDLSVVREVQFDRDMVKNHPYNAYFPQHPYYTPGDEQEHPQGKLGGYYPLIRRDLIQSASGKSVRVVPYFYALNFIGEYPEVSEILFDVQSFTKDKIVFVANQTHRRITKTYSIAGQETGAPYCIDLTLLIEGDSRGLWLSSGVPEVELISGTPAPMLKYRIVKSGNKAEVNEISLPKEQATVNTVNPNWINTGNGFFGLIVDPLTKIEPGYRVQYVPGTVVPSRLVEIDPEYNLFKADKMPGYMAMLPIKARNGSLNIRVFAGPYADNILKTIDKTFTDPATGLNPGYIDVQSFHGWFAFISEPFAKFLYIVMNFFHTLTNSWGISIILLTVVLRLMLYPLNAWSARSMVKMQEIAPKVQAVQEKYKNDPRKAQLEVMNLYRESGANPFSGCFPILIQIPFLIGMFGLLKTTFSLRGASFIPGWINDLSAPDVLFSWDKPIFFFGTSFHLLPFILGLVMFIQPRITSNAPKDPNQMTEQQRQARAMGNIMAIVFTAMFYNFPSGLNLYWLFSMLLGMLQQWWTQKQMAAKKGSIIEAKPVKAKAKK